MEILLYMYYFFRSVFLRGFINTLILLRAEAIYDKKFGIKTSSIKKSDSKDYFHYQGASYKVLFRIFSEVFPGTKNHEFVDIGCGKGRALFVAENCGYNKVTGIELDEELVNDAEANLLHCKLKRAESKIHFINQNATLYAYKNTPTVYFLFNPFNEKTLAEVIQRIREASQAETLFIYMNPLYTAAFERSGIRRVKKFKTRFYTEAIVYQIDTAATYMSS